MAAVAEHKKKISAWRALGLALGNRKTGFMLLFGFASGLPFALFLGTLFAWLTEADVDLETMGIFSLIGLAYAFQFLWSPLLDKVVDRAGQKGTKSAKSKKDKKKDRKKRKRAKR